MITIVKPGFYWPETTLEMFPLLLTHIERCGRICYKSEKLITDDSANKFVEKICKNRHESVLEHFSITAIVVCSRACSHQLVRHRIGSYSQESQKYVNYGKDDSLQVICPPSIGLPPGSYELGGTSIRQSRWLEHIELAYEEYKMELADGIQAEDARFVLPNATKTELAVTYNIRSWKHFFKMRCSLKAQWEIRGIAESIRSDLVDRFPGVFS